MACKEKVMNISFSNMLATGAWMAFLSVLAIIGIIVAGGFIVAVIGKMMLGVFSNSHSQNNTYTNANEYTYVATNNQNTYNNQNAYMTQAEEEVYVQKGNATSVQQRAPQEDYSYALDVDETKAKTEEEALNNELNSVDEDDFFKDFKGDNDARFGDDDDLMGMIDEISQDVLDEEEQTALKAEEEASQANKSVLDQYSIDNFFNEQEEVEEQDDEVIDTADAYQVEETVETVVDEETMNEINALKEQVKEIVETMEENKNQNETFNEQLINILNELKEANKKEVRTEQDAEREINDLKQQLEESRLEMERQLQERMADKDAEMQAKLQEQMEASNAEIENLKAQLSELLNKMDEPEDDAQEIEPEEIDEMEALRNEVKDMLDDMREENDAKANEFNSQILEILNELKEANLKQSSQVKIETSEEAAEELAQWKEEVEAIEEDMQKQYREELLHKDDEEKAELKAQMESYSAEIGELKAQLANLMEKFNEQSESSKAENQALLDQLQAERDERVRIEQENVKKEKAQQEQLEALRKENEALADKLQARAEGDFEELTEDELEDLYSHTTTIDYNAISQMNQEQIDAKVKVGLKQSQEEIDQLKEQVSRLTAYIEEREGGLAEQINVHEVRSADFDIEAVKEITAKEVEVRVKEKLIDSLAEVELLKVELNDTKEEIEKQYKDQLADTEAGMEYDQISKLQASAEKIDGLASKLDELTEALKEEHSNAQNTSEQCVEQIETSRDSKVEEVKQSGLDAEFAVIGPKNNQVALVATDEDVAETIENIDIETAKRITDAEIDEIVAIKLEQSNKEIESLKEQIAELKKDIVAKDEQLEKQNQTSVPAVRSPLFDVEAIKRITAQEVEIKVQERLAEAMKEIEQMKQQLELSKREIEKEYKEQMAKNAGAESEIKEKLKDSAAEVIELKEQLADLTEQLAVEHEEAKQNSEAIVEQLVQNREEMAKQLVFNQESEEMVITTATEVTVIGPKNNQVALVTGMPMTSEVVEDIPTIDIETVKKLAEEEIEEKVEQRMTDSIIEIEELKRQILNLSIQIQEIKNGTPDNDDEKPIVFHYSTEQAYVERLAILEERLKSAKKDLKINNKELKPLQKVNKTLERDRIKLRRRDAIAAKKKVALYGVNNYVDIDREKAEKLAQELEMLDGLRLSVSHCEEVMNANIDRYPILVHTDKILRENIANIESDIATLNKELQVLRENNGSQAE